MRISRAPFRITLGGGGTDLGFGGACIAAAIDKHMTVAVSESFDDRYLIRYSKLEQVERAASIKHPIVRAAIERLKFGPGLDVTSTADIPAGTGLGSSGSFTVALLQALTGTTSRPWLARMACELDTGKQDQHAAVYGGVNLFTFAETTTIEPIETTLDTKLALYYTGRRREAAKQKGQTNVDHEVARQQVADSVEALRANDIDWFGKCLLDQWYAKWQRDRSKFHDNVQLRLGPVMDRGATGAKLVGAGGGGFLLVANDNKNITEYLIHYGHRRVPFRFDHTGVTQVV